MVLVYQLCLRWFGRERLEGLMTIAQVMVSVAAVLSGQILPQLVFRLDHTLNVGEISWWINLLPPAWFAGLDDALDRQRDAGFLAAGGAGGDGHRDGSVGGVWQTGAGLRNRPAGAQRNAFPPRVGKPAAAAGSTGWSTCRP